jgi:hypothetical protein
MVGPPTAARLISPKCALQRRAEEIFAQYYGEPAKMMKAMDLCIKEYLETRSGAPPEWCNAEKLLEHAEYQIAWAHGTREQMLTPRRQRQKEEAHATRSAR